jgi:hypothetical protein
LSRLLELRPLGGQLSGHVFENPGSGVPRDLYWWLVCDFAPIEWENSEWSVSLRVDWLTFARQRWAGADAAGLVEITHPDRVETSLYLFDLHQDATLETLHLRRLADNAFVATVMVTCEPELLDGTRLPRTSVAWRGAVMFDGIVIVRENLFPKPSAPDEAAAVLRAFADPSDFLPPVLEGSQFVFRPLPVVRPIDP